MDVISNQLKSIFSISTSFGALFDLGILLFISVAFTTADIGAQTLIFSSLLLPERYNLDVFKREVYLLAGARALFDIGSVLVIFPFAAYNCEHHEDAVTEDDTSPDADDDAAVPLKKKRQARSSPAFTSDDEEDFLAPRPRKTLTQTEIFNNTGLTVTPINLVATPAPNVTSPTDFDHIEVNVLDSTTAVNENRATIRKPRWSDIFEAPEETSFTPQTSLV